jgi:predicted enzyme related to lactoylglutathione lyase
LIGAIPPAGPMVSLRANTPEGFPGVVPYLRVDHVERALQAVVSAGGTVERAPWHVPLAGRFARFTDEGGTVYGLTDMAVAGPTPAMAPPFGDNPRPAAHALCSLEMYAADGESAARFFGTQFGWGTVSPMPQYMMFDPGAGIGGVFQSHTPGLRALGYIYVADVAAALAAIEAAGGQRSAEPMSAPGMGTFGYFNDVCGTPMGLIGP